MYKLNIFAGTICAFVTKQMFMTYKYRAEQKMLDKQRTNLYSFVRTCALHRGDN